MNLRARTLRSVIWELLILELRLGLTLILGWINSWIPDPRFPILVSFSPIPFPWFLILESWEKQLLCPSHHDGCSLSLKIFCIICMFAIAFTKKKACIMRWFNSIQRVCGVKDLVGLCQRLRWIPSSIGLPFPCHLKSSIKLNQNICFKILNKVKSDCANTYEGFLRLLAFLFLVI